MNQTEFDQHRIWHCEVSATLLFWLEFDHTADKIIAAFEFLLVWELQEGELFSAAGAMLGCSLQLWRETYHVAGVAPVHEPSGEVPRLHQLHERREHGRHRLSCSHVKRDRRSRQKEEPRHQQRQRRPPGTQAATRPYLPAAARRAAEGRAPASRAASQPAASARRRFLP